MQDLLAFDIGVDGEEEDDADDSVEDTEDGRTTLCRVELRAWVG